MTRAADRSKIFRVTQHLARNYLLGEQKPRALGAGPDPKKEGDGKLIKAFIFYNKKMHGYLGLVSKMGRG